MNAQPDQLLRAAEVIKLMGIPRSSFYDLVAKGRFPKPMKLTGKLVLWSAREIAEWQQERMAER
jgi:prophage regulatory protein